MALLAVLAEPFAVVGGDGDDGAREAPALLEPGQEPAELLVHVGDLAVVRTAREAPEEGLGRPVARVRVVVVHPEEEGSLGLAEP